MMIRLLVSGTTIICLLFLGSDVCAQETTHVDSSYLNQQYTLRTTFFKQAPKRRGQIMFIGDSLTEGGRWAEISQKKNVVNRGISGDVTYGVLARLDDALLAKPKKIFLLCGINDMKRGTPNAVILENITRIISRVKKSSPKTKLYIQSLLPVNEAMLPESYQLLSNEKINRLNELLAQACRESGVQFIDLHPVFADESGVLRRELSIDGLHLWQVSYVNWVDYLKKSKVL